MVQSIQKIGNETECGEEKYSISWFFYHSFSKFGFLNFMKCFFLNTHFLILYFVPLSKKVLFFHAFGKRNQSEQNYYTDKANDDSGYHLAPHHTKTHTYSQTQCPDNPNHYSEDTFP